MNMDSIKSYFIKLNKEGIPIPFLKDPQTDKGSVSLTMMFISFNVVLVGLCGKLAGFFGGVNIEQAIYFYTICSSLYFARKITSNKGKLTVEGNKENEQK